MSSARDGEQATSAADARTIPEEDRGLGYDMQTLVDRRRLLGLFGGLTVAGLLASSTALSGAAAASSLVEIPDETGGPFTGSGANGINVLDDSGIVRRDIRSSFGSSTRTAAGVRTTVRLTVRDAATGDALPGAAVYLWHCDKDGRYSLYSDGLKGENYLRGVQVADRSGNVVFDTIYPGCYEGRWPHMHFEVYSRLRDAVTSGPTLKTSQIALPRETTEASYARRGYGISARNLGRLSIATDFVFGDDGGIHQIATMTGSPARGYVATLTVGV